MNIAVNTRLLLPGRLDGIGWFTAETLRRIVTAHPEHEFYFFFDRKPDPQFIYAANVHPVVLCPQARHPVLWYLFFQWSVRLALRRYRIDLFLSPDGYSVLDTKVPTLTVIHDINFEHAKDYLKPSHQRYMTCYSPQFARYSTRLATVSEYSRQDIAATYNLSPDKIDVVYDGAHEGYRPLPEEERQRVRQQFADGCPYIIFISTIIKRKNLASLLTAFDQFKASDRQGIKLLVVGARVWWQDELKAAYDGMRHQDDVVFVGRAEADDLPRLLASASALVYPSLFEGFGIPILEAFYAETPVVASDCTSMPEVAGDAALLVNPTDPAAICAAIRRLVEDPVLARTLVERGRQQRQKFSWDITARLLWESMMRTIGEK